MDVQNHSVKPMELCVVMKFKSSRQMFISCYTTGIYINFFKDCMFFSSIIAALLLTPAHVTVVILFHMHRCMAINNWPNLNANNWRYDHEICQNVQTLRI